MAAQILQALNATISTSGQSKLNVQFGAYASFFSFFSLAQLPSADSNFYGIPDYASFMAFELVTNSSASPFPDSSDISVRFLFHNGTTSTSSTPSAYPLFGKQDTVISWETFAMEMGKIAVGNESAWCTACGNTTGMCAPQSTASESSSSQGGVSRVAAGVIGAAVALAVLLLAEALIMLLGGWRLRHRDSSDSVVSRIPVGKRGESSSIESKTYP